MKFKSLKARVLVWFGGVAFVVLTLFALFFNYFLNSSIDNNIKLKLQLVANNYAQYIQMRDVGIAILENGKVERKMRDVKEFLARINYSPSTLSPAELKKELEDWVEFHNYSRIHFDYQYYQFGDVKLRKKFYFFSLRFCAHRC